MGMTMQCFIYGYQSLKYIDSNPQLSLRLSLKYITNPIYYSNTLTRQTGVFK